MTKISVSDLENIQETETPPQSPSSQAHQAYSGDDMEGHDVELKTHPSHAAAHYFKVVFGKIMEKVGKGGGADSLCIICFENVTFKLKPLLLLLLIFKKK